MALTAAAGQAILSAAGTQLRMDTPSHSAEGTAPPLLALRRAARRLTRKDSACTLLFGLRVAGAAQGITAAHAPTVHAGFGVSGDAIEGAFEEQFARRVSGVVHTRVIGRCAGRECRTALGLHALIAARATRVDAHRAPAIPDRVAAGVGHGVADGVCAGVARRIHCRIAITLRSGVAAVGAGGVGCAAIDRGTSVSGGTGAAGQRRVRLRRRGGSCAGIPDRGARAARDRRIRRASASRVGPAARAAEQRGTCVSGVLTGALVDRSGAAFARGL